MFFLNLKFCALIQRGQNLDQENHLFFLSMRQSSSTFGAKNLVAGDRPKAFLHVKATAKSFALGCSRR
jgi:hypothetical protein